MLYICPRDLALESRRGLNTDSIQMATARFKKIYVHINFPLFNGQLGTDCNI